MIRDLPLAGLALCAASLFVWVLVIVFADYTHERWGWPERLPDEKARARG